MSELRTNTIEGGDGAGAGHASPSGADDARFEALLEQALRVDVPEAGVVRRRPRAVKRWARMALAAAIVLAVGLTFKTLQDAVFFGSDDLGIDVVAHALHEPAALIRTRDTVSDSDMERVLQAAGASLSALDNPVSYVKLCPFRGQMVAHLAVQGTNGPVTVLLLPNENIDTSMPILDDGFVGTIVSLGPMGGSIAVVGEYAGDIDDIKDQVADAVRWRL